MERRKHIRLAHKVNAIPVTFSGDAKGTGTLYDLSPGGCKIDTRTTPPLGASLILRLGMPSEADPIEIDTGVVGWTIKDKYFGVKFLQVDPTDRIVLNTYLASRS